MAPKRSKTTKSSLKKSRTMTATAAAGQDYLKRAWGEDGLNRINALLDARDKEDTTSNDETSSASSGTRTATASSSTSTKTKPKLSKARTMQNTTKEAKALLGTQVLGDTRAETKRRQAAVKAKKTLEEVSKPTGLRKPTLKRLGTMAKTAREGKAYIKRTGGNKKKGRKATGKKRTGSRTKKTTK